MSKLHCPHLGDLVDNVRNANTTCTDCNFSGPNLWICLHRKCLNVGCSEQNEDHSTQHYHKNNAHCVHMNMSSQRMWCFECEREVFPHERCIPQTSANVEQNYLIDGDDHDETYNIASSSSSTMTSNSSSRSLTGLMGLQNIANTCYMNSALQALSNVRPLTYYFLNCGDLVEHSVEQSVAAHRTKAGLAKSYQRLIYDIWLNSDEAKNFITPRGILYCIRSVHPMFRGFQQHDTQEFLRCFMDQLHEELKEQDPITKPNFTIQSTKRTNKSNSNNNNNKDDDENDVVNDDITLSSTSNSRSSSSLSITEYETCESSMSTEDPPSNSFIKPMKRPSLQSERSHTIISHTTTTTATNSQTAATTTTTTTTTTQSTTPSTPLARSIISDVFDGKLLSSVQCLTCDRISTREETFQDLSLAIPNRDYLNVLHQTHSASAQSLNQLDPNGKYGDGWFSWIWGVIRSWLWGPSVALHDCMSSFFSADELKGDNMYSCEKCNKLRTGVKYSQILDLPEVLCIHLKRFRHDLSYSSKISSHVHFPLEGFDMRPYLHKNCNSSISLYNLSSIICHHGTVGGGHYTCIARNAITNRWYEYDDHRVTEVLPETVQNCQAYVLFYHKQNPQMDLIRAAANELSMSNPVRTADIRFYITREWLVRFNTFAEPGPIDNWSILCSHGGILQSKIDILSRVAVPISQPLWDFLYCKYGGGPALNVLFECEHCKRAAEVLTQRRLYELSAFTKYNGIDADVESCAIFAISMVWLRKWQQFVRGTTNKEPGPITNANIAATVTESASLQQPSTLIHNVRAGSDYAQLNSPQWRLLHQIYGGGPEILLRGSLSDEHDMSADSVDQEIDESQENNNDNLTSLSDTESNIADTQSRDTVSSRQDDISEKANTEESTDNIDGETSTEHSKTTRLSNGYHIGYNKMKPKASAFRKRNKRSRNTLKNADFFGAKGHYSLNGAADSTLMNVPSQRYETHSNEDAERSDSGVSVTQSRPSSTMPEEKPDKRHMRKNFAKVPLHRPSNKVNKSKSQDSVVTLKKFVPLHASNESFETDA